MNLITGTSSGLGKYLLQRFGGKALRRDEDFPYGEEFDMIIHCGFDGSRVVTHDNVGAYVSSNFNSTVELLSLWCQRFVFISTIDVYPKKYWEYFDESYPINANDIEGIYGVTKFMSEAIALKEGNNSLVLRCGSLLGEHVRDNTLTKMVKGEPIGLKFASTMNFVTHRMVGDLITAHASGIVNCCARNNIGLGYFDNYLKYGGISGNHLYQAPTVNNELAWSLVPEFYKTSKQIGEEFVDVLRAQQSKG